MILVLLGTQNNSFERLLKEIQKLILEGKIKEEVIVQAGHTKFKECNGMKVFSLISNTKLMELMKKANIIITHGGVGSIVSSLKMGKKIIAVPRLSKYEEHVNDHQIQIVDNFDSKHYLIGIKDVSELEEALNKIKDFKPAKYQSNTANFIKIIEDYIDNN